jgi:hypothetical protein
MSEIMHETARLFGGCSIVTNFGRVTYVCGLLHDAVNV